MNKYRVFSQAADGITKEWHAEVDGPCEAVAAVKPECPEAVRILALCAPVFEPELMVA